MKRIKPVLTRRMIWCCGCVAETEARLTSGLEVWPDRRDLEERPVWVCDLCRLHVGTHWKTSDPTRPMGDIPTPEIARARREIHKILDPLWRRSPVLFPRRRLYAEIAERMGLPGGYHTGELRNIDDARRAWKIIRDIGRNGLPQRVKETADAEADPVH